uniref:Uncharacterized protein n=1 Tax=Arsenophonus nasoniae TaxID=638 RepID=D2U022_9GAMM|nr:hypothetical protein ARN_18240 [Arsenophonus nasoniae]
MIGFICSLAKVMMGVWMYYQKNACYLHKILVFCIIDGLIYFYQFKKLVSS